jgi:hypothetical protein
MRSNVHHRLKVGRVRTGKYTSDDSFGLCGMFHIRSSKTGRLLKVIASTALGGPGDWEHVSVSVDGQTGRFSKCPIWEEMCEVKSLFWEDEETVIQFHPKASESVNIGEVLHLWKLCGHEHILPPKFYV